MSVLAVAHLSRSFGSLKVVDNVSFELKAGEALGIIGPNGAGKTTLFNLLDRRAQARQRATSGWTGAT